MVEDDEDAETNRQYIIVVLVKGHTERVGKKVKKGFENFINCFQKYGNDMTQIRRFKDN